MRDVGWNAWYNMGVCPNASEISGPGNGHQNGTFTHIQIISTFFHEPRGKSIENASLLQTVHIYLEIEGMFSFFLFM